MREAWYWIRNIRSFANGAPILLFINQKDQNPSANVNLNGLRAEYSNLKGVGIISALKDTREEFTIRSGTSSAGWFREWIRCIRHLQNHGCHL